MADHIRVRFAPSPTGPLHIGGVRTALFNYLFAKKNNGIFILRIEDTDRSRYVRGAEEYIIESLEWCGLTPDEGVMAGGNYGPYRQSERIHIYKKYAEQLIKSGNAYYAFDTPEELESIRKKFEAEGKTFSYDAISRMEFRNSLTIPVKEVRHLLDEEAPFVVRFKMPENEMVVFTDLIRGNININTSILDDKVLFKSDGFPTYHLANVVDDHLMEISHVIRGEEWLPSTPLHILLYRSFGWQHPDFAHMPLTLKPEGKGKLSKRDGDRLGFPVFPLQWTNPENGEVSSGYRESGYFPEAFLNILALLGWNPGTEQEIFSLKELVEAFSIGGINKSGSRFDPDKAKWFNRQYLISKPDSEIADLFMIDLKNKGISAEKGKVSRICGLVKERVNFVKEIWDQAYFFFKQPETYDEKAIQKFWKEDTSKLMLSVRKVIQSTSPFNPKYMEENIKSFIGENGLDFGRVMNPLRILIVGTAMGPHLFDIMEIIGMEDTLERIDKGLMSIT
ncbi:MAG: glutamate--tRNA ligase [Bacteroidales bacterium]|nr:glutamate--tRNA ligase [Bacteroidales bacterium]